MEKDPQPEECIVQIPGNTDSYNFSKWVNDVDSELIELARSRELENWQNLSIYVIPHSLKHLNTRAYKPQMVSIGPYHHGQLQLKSMEEDKKRAFITFLDESRKTFEYYVHALTPMVEDLKNAYHNLDPKWKYDTQAFLQLMIVDGCFLLEIMRSTTVEEPIGYAVNDPVFGNHGKLCFVPYLKRDMLMLENQLPLRVLVVLVATRRGVPISDGEKLLGRLILEFFSSYDNRNIRNYENCLHILDFYRRSMILRSAPHTTQNLKAVAPRTVRRKTEAYIRPATELKEAGVRFERLNTCSLEDISFQGGTLSLPQITVDDALESNYLNMMAFERFHVGAGYEVTSFVLFMDRIIDSARDVRLLNSYGIMHNAESIDKAVASLFSSLGRDASMDPHCHLAMVQQQVAGHCQKPLPRLMIYSKNLMYYCNNLVGLSIIGAFSIFALAATQTLYTVLGYYNSKQ